MVLFLLYYSCIGIIKSDEGMFNISLSKKQYDILKRKGLDLPLDAIYGTNPSMMDATVMFGDGGTGVIVSDKGLLLTNYHLASRFIQSIIQDKEDYIKEGFYAKNIQKEIPIKDLFIRFQVKEIDITSYVLNDLESIIDYNEKQKAIKLKIKNYITENTPKDQGFSSDVKEVYGGNKYFYYLFKTYNDIRLVAIPPQSIARFGGEKYNWEWPRYSADFALFRIYSGQNNEPINYSSENIPYKPSKVISFSSKKIAKDDFIMTIGFPGNTSMTETSYFLEDIVLESNERRIPLMNRKLDAVEEYMNQSDSLYTKYLPLFADLNNNVRKREGLCEGLRLSNGITKKRREEKIIKGEILDNVDLNRRYSNLLDEISKTQIELKKYMLPLDYLEASFFGIDMLRIAYTMYNSYIKNIETFDSKKKEALIKRLKMAYEYYSLEIDQKIFIETLNTYITNVPEKYKAPILDKGGSMEHLYSELYSKSIFTSYQKVEEAIVNNNNYDILLNDPAIKLVAGIDSIINQEIIGPLTILRHKRDSLAREYKSLNFALGKYSWPDANRTLRISYGTVKGSTNKYPSYYTEYDELIQKMMDEKNMNIAVPSEISAKLKTYNKDLKINFITDCQTTGGNSGSPVLNNKGELVGLNFDRIKEGVVGDYIYDPEVCRNISLSTDYILYVLDKLGNSTNIISELKIEH